MSGVGSDDSIDQLIKTVAAALSIQGITLDQIHDELIDRGWSEEDIFLAIKAGQNLVDSLSIVENELKKRPPPFGRK